MIQQEDAKTYFGREILEVLKEGDLVELAQGNFPFIYKSKAVYLGQTSNDNFVEIIGRPNKFRLIEPIISFNCKLDEISIKTNQIISFGDFYDERRSLRMDEKREELIKLVRKRKIFLYDITSSYYNHCDILLGEHGL